MEAANELELTWLTRYPLPHSRMIGSDQEESLVTFSHGKADKVWGSK